MARPQTLFNSTFTSSSCCELLSPSLSVCVTAFPTTNVSCMLPAVTQNFPFLPIAISNAIRSPNPCNTITLPSSCCIPISNLLAIPKLISNTMPPLSSPIPSPFPVEGLKQAISTSACLGAEMIRANINVLGARWGRVFLVAFSNESCDSRASGE